jgi:CRISPR/Cas system-associated protein Csm6
MGDPTPFFIMGTAFGVLATLLIQTYARRKVRKALATEELPTGQKIKLLSLDNQQLQEKNGRLEERISVLERIATDAPARLSAEIDNLC